MKLKKGTLLSCVVSGALGASAASLAQETARTSVLEEIIVTAEKREQSLQDVPVAVSAYTSQRRDLIGVNTIEDFARITPSLSYRNDDRLSIRGFGRLTNSIGTDPSVALYSDGVFSTSMADTSTPSLFIERTEILRGPQGTLYGRNSIGGAINVIAKRPTDTFQGEVRATVGDYSTLRTDALLRGPISDNLRFLVGGYYDQRDEGFIKNRGPGGDTATIDRWGIESQLEADLGDSVVARLRYSKFEWLDSYGVGNTLEASISPYNTVSFTGTGTSALYYNTVFGYGSPNPGVTNPYTIDTNWTAIGTLKDHHRIHLDVTADLDGATVKFLSGYQQYAYHTSSDSDGTPRTAPFDMIIPAFGDQLSVDLDGAGPLPTHTFARPAFTARNISPDARTFYSEYQQWQSNEINVSSNGDGALQWIVGLFQYSQTWNQPQGIRIEGDPALMNPVDSPANPSGAFLYVDGHLETDSYAGFGQIDWEFTDRWTMTLGARYTKDKKRGIDIARYVARLPTTAIAIADTPGVLESAFIGAVRAGQTPLPPDATLEQINAAIPGLAPLIIPAVLAQTQGLALDVTRLQVCGAAPCPADLVDNPGGGLRRNLKGDWDAVTGTLGLQWEPDDRTNAYLRYSRGYKSGGWLGSNGLDDDPYADPEYVDSYEFGLKRAIGSQWRVNAAAYYSKYDGMQTPLTVSLGTITASSFLNLDARVYGLELETAWSPIDDMEVFLSYAYLNTEITNGCCFVDNADPTASAPGAKPRGVFPNGDISQTLKGNPLPLSPENKYTLGANYTWRFGAGSLTASGTYTHTDDQQSTIWSNPMYTAPSFEVADFRLLWNDSQNRYTMIGFVKNAFDEVGYSRVGAGSPTPVGVRRTAGLIFPRTYGMELQYRFGGG